jgi:hypothetical protein
MILSNTDILIFRTEIQQCFSAKRIPVFILLALIGVFLVVQESELSPLVIVFLVVFAILESQFNNILFRSSHELEALSMFPITWRRIVLVKNLATIVLTAIVSIIVAMAVLYFVPQPIETSIIGEAILYSATIIFPLLHVGNIESVRAPRRNAGWQTDDLVQAVGMFLFVVVLSIPYVLFTVLLRFPLLNILYAGAVAWFWYAKSIPNTSFTIEQKKTLLCTTM